MVIIGTGASASPPEKENQKLPGDSEAESPAARAFFSFGKEPSQSDDSRGRRSMNRLGLRFRAIRILKWVRITGLALLLTLALFTLVMWPVSWISFEHNRRTMWSEEDAWYYNSGLDFFITGDPDAGLFSMQLHTERGYALYGLHFRCGWFYITYSNSKSNPKNLRLKEIALPGLAICQLGDPWSVIRAAYIKVHLCILVVAFATWPILELLRGPVLRWRRTRSGRCFECGYDLRGNQSGICPECGKATPTDCPLVK